MKKLAKVLAIVVLGVLALGLFGGSESCAPKEEPTTTAPVATVVVPVVPVVPAEPTAIEPCVDGSQDSCVLWNYLFGKGAEDFPDASITWLDCEATYVSNHYTGDEFAALAGDEASLSALTADVVAACGLPN